MKAWRLALAAGLITLAGVPLLLPFGEALLHSSLPDADWERLFGLTANTFLLATGTVALALPLGTLLAVLVFRTDLPGRRFFLGSALFALFVPLPLIVSAWQALVGSDGIFPLLLPVTSSDRPLSAGLLPAIWIHALAGVPWVILIVGIGLNSVESALEEESLLAAGPWRVLCQVSLPRCRGNIVAAGLWLAVQAAADIQVTAIVKVRTFAEELDTQFNMGGAGLARTLLLTVPVVVVVWTLLLFIVPRLDRAMPALQLGFTRSPLVYLGKSRFFWAGACLLAGTAFALAPFLGLVWKLGLAGSPPGWSSAHAGRQFVGEGLLYGVQVFQTLVVALLTGVVTAATALVCCWVAHSSRPLRMVLLCIVTLSWVLPAPVVGLGIKEVIFAVVRWCPVEPLPMLLYDGPSPVPIVWAHWLRFFPCAVAILWSAVRMVPLELRDAARLEGAGPGGELFHVYLPMTRRASALAVLAVTALCLGEIGAGARVETPGWETFAKLLFDRMHYGADANVAALVMLVLAEIGLAFALVSLIWRAGRH